MAYQIPINPIHKESDIRTVEDLRRLDWRRITGRDVLSATQSSRRDVGVSFEPRLQVEYDLEYPDGETEHRRLLLVLGKDERTVVSANLDYKI